jgi:hypothetical protein
MVSTQRAQVVTDVAYTYGKGYIFRDETVVFADDGIVDYLAPDGARIGVGQAYADVYPAADLKASEINDLQSRIDELSLRISMLSSGVGGKTEISDLASVSESLEASYYAYIDSVANGDRIEFHRNAAGFDDALLEPFADSVEVAVSGNERLVGIADSDKRLLHVFALHSGSEKQASVRGAFFSDLDLVADHLLHCCYLSGCSFALRRLRLNVP